MSIRKFCVYFLEINPNHSLKKTEEGMEKSQFLSDDIDERDEK